MSSPGNGEPRFPDELRALEQWVIWRAEPDDKGRMTKRPYAALNGHRRASVTNPDTWTSFDKAAAFLAARPGEFDGLGFVFTADDSYCGIDLDDAFSAARIERTDRLVAAFDSYTEVSPSGEGLHIIVRGAVASGRRHDGIEVYDRDRYFTMTGNPYAGVVRPVEARQPVLDRLIAEYLPREAVAALEEPGEPITTELPDDAVIAAIRRADAPVLHRLLDGEWQDDYPSGSEADFALANHLAYWTGGNYEQTLRILRSTPLWDEKWERADYQLRTAARAVRDVQASGRIAPIYFPSNFTALPSTQPPEYSEKRRVGFRLTPEEEFLERPVTQRWIIRGVLPADAFIQLIGPPGAGKTFVALDMAMCVACNLNWKGHATNGGPVIYINGEGHFGLRLRLRAWRQHHKKLPWRDHKSKLSVSEQPIHLSDNVEELISALDDVVARDGPPVLIVLDTLARNFGGGDENSTQDMNQVVGKLDEIRERYGSTILVLHHTGLKHVDRGRGNSALIGAVDGSLLLHQKDGQVVLTFKKIREARLPEPKLFRLLETAIEGLFDEFGDAVTSAVVVSAAESAFSDLPERSGAECRGENQVKIREILRAHCPNPASDDGGKVGMLLDDCRAFFVENYKGSNARSAFDQARSGLERRGRVEVYSGRIRWIG